MESLEPDAREPLSRGTAVKLSLGSLACLVLAAGPVFVLWFHFAMGESGNRLWMPFPAACGLAAALAGGAAGIPWTFYRQSLRPILLSAAVFGAAAAAAGAFIR